MGCLGAASTAGAGKRRRSPGALRELLLLVLTLQLVDMPQQFFIACLLIALWTGRKPTLSTYRMLCWYFSGWASQEELLRHINKLQHQDEQDKLA